MVGGFLEDKMTQAMRKGIGGSPTTVGIETEGVVSDATVLGSRVAAVAAVADAFESARRTA